MEARQLLVDDGVRSSPMLPLTRHLPVVPRLGE